MKEMDQGHWQHCRVAAWLYLIYKRFTSAMVQDGVTEYSVTPFWGERSCPAHQADGTPACCGCSQLKPASEAWAELADGRQTCLACLQSIVTDTADAQPLYSQARRH